MIIQLEFADDLDEHVNKFVEFNSIIACMQIQDIRNDITLCVVRVAIATCPTGTTVNATNPQVCIPCAVGYYQPIATSLTSVNCLLCPNGTTTTSTMSTNFTQCVRKSLD